MITWVTVWVLTVTTNTSSYQRQDNLRAYYQLQYSSQKVCEDNRKYHSSSIRTTRCDFQQIPVVVNK